MKVTKLKGGSLSSTCLHETENLKFVRKSVSTKKDREYGFVRWYSQLKKLQRYNELFPGLVPKVLAVGYENNNAYFDLEYLEGFQDIKTIFSQGELSEESIEKINTALWQGFDCLHQKTYTANFGASYLYYIEEVLQKIKDARTVKDFDDFYKIDSYHYQNKNVPGITKHLNTLENFFKNLKLGCEEYTHGNPTLENTMFSFEENKVVFIDLYEESIIDSKFLDYSQVLQCSNSLYGFVNDREIKIDNNKLWHELEIPNNFKIFNQQFTERLDTKNLIVVNVLEATQFIRMLPFKCFANHIDKAKYFYVHACYLLDNIFG